MRSRASYEYVYSVFNRGGGSQDTPISPEEYTNLRDTEVFYSDETNKGATLSTVGDKVMVTGKENSDWKNFEYDRENSLKTNEEVKVGDVTLTINEGYGMRDWAGRKGQHSNGIDLKTDTDYMVFLRPGKISAVKPNPGRTSLNKPSPGNIVEVTHADGSVTQYMHLDDFTDKDLERLKVGTKVTRGQKLHGYKVGSGSGTGVHVKVRVFNKDNEFWKKSYKDGDKTKTKTFAQSIANIDPSTAIKGGIYKWLPQINSLGELSIKTNNNLTSYRLGGLLYTK